MTHKRNRGEIEAPTGTKRKQTLPPKNPKRHRRSPIASKVPNKQGNIKEAGNLRGRDKIHNVPGANLQTRTKVVVQAPLQQEHR